MKAIEIKNLQKKFKNKIVVNSINLNIEEGELFALLGVNGAGKTTTIKMLSGLSKPTSGDALIFNKSILEDLDKIKEIIGISPQETSIAPNLTVKENLEFMAEIYGFKKDNFKERTTEIINKFSLEEIEKQKAKTLSGGWQRRLSIAMALISEPKILFLDEPTLGLDVLARRELWGIINNLKGKTTIILTTHYLEEAEALSDRIAIMVKGEIKALGTAVELKELTNTTRLEEAFVKIAEGEMKYEK